MLTLVLLLAALVALSYTPKLLKVWRDRPDKAWKATGIRQIYRGHDEQKAVQAVKRAEQQAVARQLVEAIRSEPPKKERAEKKKPATISSFKKRVG